MSGTMAGWDKNSIIDGKGIAILNLWLHDDPQIRFLPSLKSKDTEPNYDGYITYGRPNGRKVSPVGRINVQVKSTSLSLQNSNTTRNISQYKYECATEVLFAAQHKVSEDPTGLVIVDTCNLRAYWISLTHEYLEGLDLKQGQTTKTLYFDDGYLMQDHDEFFSRIVEFKHHHDKFRESLINDRLLVSSAISGTRLAQLQELALDLNVRCRSDLYFLKEGTFPDAWAMALRYTEKSGRSYLGITPLRRGENDVVLIGDLDVREEPSLFSRGPLTHRFEDDPFLTICCNLDCSLQDMYEELLGNWAREFSATFMLRPSNMPDALLEEVFFWYADLLAILVPEIEAGNKPGTFPADRLLPRECRRLCDAPYYAGWKRWMEVAQYTHISKEGIHYAAPFSDDPHENDIQESRKWIKDYIENGSSAFEEDAEFKIELEGKDVPFGFIREVVEEIERRNLSLSRPWKCSFKKKERQPSRERFSVFHIPDDRGCSQEDYKANLAKLYELYANLREGLLFSFFGENFPFEKHVFRKDITVYCDGSSYCEMTERFSGQEYGANCEIRPYSEYDPDWIQSHDCEAPQYVNLISKGTTCRAPVFTNSIPLYSLFEHDIIEVLERLFPKERLRASRECYGYRIKKADALETAHFIIVRRS